MNRREFIAGAAAMAASTALPTQISMPNKPKPWKPNQNLIWTGPDPKRSSRQRRARYQELQKRGITGIFLGGFDQSEAEIIREVGLDLHIWMWTTNRGEDWIRKNHPEWFQVSRSGKSCFDQPPYVDYYRWLSPFIPGVQNYLKDRVAELAVRPEVQGVHLDYVRYPDVILPRALWETYKLDQTEELPDYDFDYSEPMRKAFQRQHKRDPLQIADPAHDTEWLHFRYDAITKLVKMLAAEAHREEKQITAAVFPTPRLARKICRQDWDKWPLDAAAPMIYHSFYNEPVSWVGDCVLENIHATRTPIVAGLYMPAFASPAEFKTGLDLVRKRGGSGVSLFGDVGAAYWDVFEDWAESSQ